MTTRWYHHIIPWLMVIIAALLVIGFVMDPGNEPRTGGGSDCLDAQIADSTDYPNC